MYHSERRPVNHRNDPIKAAGGKELWIVVLLFLLPLAGCNLPRGMPAPATDTVLIYTQAAETLSVQLTAQIPSTSASQLPGLPTAEQPAQTVQASFTATLTTTATPTPSLTPTPPAVLIFEDDFSDENNWYTEQNKRFSLELTDGGYKISINIKNAPIWSTRDQSFDDVVVEVDTLHLAGAKTGYAGLVCRHQDGDNYYALVISSDGAFGIAKMEGGEFEFIQEGVDPSGVIKSGSANRLRAGCIGETLSLYANDQLLLQVQDDDIADGAVGLLAVSRMETPFEAFFDNFAIYQP